MKKKNFQTCLLVAIFGLMLSGVSSPLSLAYPDEALQIIGEVNHPISLTLEELIAMPQTTVNAPLYCYDELVTSGDWTGVQLSFLLEMAEYNENAQSIQFDAEDGYSITILITEALREDVIIAYEKDDQPETLRLVIPGANGNLWISMINRLTLIKDAVATEQAPFKPTELAKPSPTPQQSTTPQPTPSPQPTPNPQSTPSPSTLSSTATQGKAKSPSLEWVTVATAGLVLALACASLLFYFKKRHH